MVPIQVPQVEMRMTVVTTTQVHLMVVTMTQMMIQNQPSPQTHRQLSLTMRSRYIT
jgi:hypothetical protein